MINENAEHRKFLRQFPSLLGYRSQLHSKWWELPAVGYQTDRENQRERKMFLVKLNHRVDHKFKPFVQNLPRFNDFVE